MSKKTLPKSKAKTAYGLLSEVAKLALEEPKRIHMNYWKLTERAGNSEPTGSEYPACGTIGCIGGWTETLKPAGESAESILRLTSQQSQELFYDKALLDDAGCRYTGGNGQTLSHAKKVAKHIRKFQKTYRTQLLTTKV